MTHAAMNITLYYCYLMHKILQKWLKKFRTDFTSVSKLPNCPIFKTRFFFEFLVSNIYNFWALDFF